MMQKKTKKDSGRYYSLYKVESGFGVSLRVMKVCGGSDPGNAECRENGDAHFQITSRCIDRFSHNEERPPLCCKDTLTARRLSSICHWI